MPRRELLSRSQVLRVEDPLAFSEMVAGSPAPGAPQFADKGRGKFVLGRP